MLVGEKRAIEGVGGRRRIWSRKGLENLRATEVLRDPSDCKGNLQWQERIKRHERWDRGHSTHVRPWEEHLKDDTQTELPMTRYVLRWLKNNSRPGEHTTSHEPRNSKIKY